MLSSQDHCGRRDGHLHSPQDREKEPDRNALRVQAFLENLAALLQCEYLYKITSLSNVDKSTEMYLYNYFQLDSKVMTYWHWNQHLPTGSHRCRFNTFGCGWKRGTILLSALWSVDIWGDSLNSWFVGTNYHVWLRILHSSWVSQRVWRTTLHSHLSHKL